MVLWPDNRTEPESVGVEKLPKTLAWEPSYWSPQNMSHWGCLYHTFLQKGSQGSSIIKSSLTVTDVTASRKCIWVCISWAGGCRDSLGINPHTWKSLPGCKVLRFSSTFFHKRQLSCTFPWQECGTDLRPHVHLVLVFMQLYLFLLRPSLGLSLSF